ncbi:hypothetical protein [Shinella lacus]|uniref:hypothetical protein n=1 Tax=Shinella lacus TaxID=2654216 RepID=UPI00210E7035|nr:hypothetical protein [Shinella lacus]
MASHAKLDANETALLCCIAVSGRAAIWHRQAECVWGLPLESKIEAELSQSVFQRAFKRRLITRVDTLEHQHLQSMQGYSREQVVKLRVKNFSFFHKIGDRKCVPSDLRVVDCLSKNWYGFHVNFKHVTQFPSKGILKRSQRHCNQQMDFQILGLVPVSIAIIANLRCHLDPDVVWHIPKTKNSKDPVKWTLTAEQIDFRSIAKVTQVFPPIAENHSIPFQWGDHVRRLIVISDIYQRLKNLPFHFEIQGELPVEIKRRLDAVGKGALLVEGLKNNPLPTSPEFMVGSAAQSLEEDMEFSILRPQAPEAETVESVLEELAVNKPVIARRGFAAFHRQRKLLTDENWAAIGSAIASDLATVSVDGDFTTRLHLLADVVSYPGSAQRAEIDIKALLGDAQFFDNLIASVSNDDDLSIGSAVFLALQAFLGKALPPPTRTAANGAKVPEASEHYDWFKGFLEGDTPLTEDQSDRIATLAKEAHIVRSLINASKAKSVNAAINSVIKAAMLKCELPRTDLTVLLDDYDYIQNLLGEDFSRTVERYAARVSTKNLLDLTLESVPAALLVDTGKMSAPPWQSFHSRVGVLLAQVPTGDWLEHLSSGSSLAEVLIRKIETSGLSIDDPDFRRVFADFIAGVLSGTISVAKNDLNYDRLLDCIDAKFHPDVIRTIRERLSNIGAATLAA